MTSAPPVRRVHAAVLPPPLAAPALQAPRPPRSPTPGSGSRPASRPTSPGDRAEAPPRPSATRLASSASVPQAMPSERQEVVDELHRRLVDAVARARTTGVKIWVRKKGERQLAQLAAKLAGRHSASCDAAQIRSITAALLRPEPPPALLRQAQQQALLARGHGAAAPAVAQPSVEPLFTFSDALLKQVSQLVHPLYSAPSTEETVLRLRRAALVMLATRNALDTYEEYTLTPGHMHINRYQSELRTAHEAVRQRLFRLLQRDAVSERAPTPELAPYATPA